ncbi:MAG: DUF5615 family PIN-like protein [bacterium]
MIFWLDAQISPYLADWISKEFDVECVPIRDINLRDAMDNEIFEQAYKEDVIVITKDSDFVHLAEQKEHGPPIIWLTMGNTSNKALREYFSETFPTVLQWLREGEGLIEMTEESTVEEVDP